MIRVYPRPSKGADNGTGVIFLSVGAIVAILRPNDELKNDSRTLGQGSDLVLHFLPDQVRALKTKNQV